MKSRVTVGVLALCALLAAAPEPTRAEERQIETVGAAPLGDGAPSRPPRELALMNAVDSAVLRAARDLLPPDFEPSEAPPGARGSDATQRWLSAKLGEDLLVYATQFAIVEDRGERPAVFHRDSGAESEYVVLASVDVDLEALRDQLGALGLLEQGGGHSEMRLVVEGLERYEPLRRLWEALEDHRGVRSVVPVEFTPGRAVLALKANRGLEEIVSDLQNEAPGGLKLVPVEVGLQEATVLVGGR